MKKECTYCKVIFERISFNYSCRNFCSLACRKKQSVKDREQKGFTKEWLYSEYITNKRTFVDIAKEIGVDQKTVWKWAKEYGIKTRKRGTNSSVWFKKGQKTRLGIKHTEETKRKISKSSKGKKPYLKNGKHWLHDKDSVNPNWKGGVTKERMALYNSLEWKKIIGLVWGKDKKICQRCGVKHSKNIVFHIHHIVSFAVKEKRCDLDNLILLCIDCHRWVHSKKNKNSDFLEKETA